MAPFSGLITLLQSLRKFLNEKIGCEPIHPPSRLLLGTSVSYFGLTITIPPMKSYAEDEPKGRFGYLDPGYITSGIISEKGDVYSFGVLLLIFLTGQKAVVTNQDGEYESINSYVKFHTCNGQIQSIVDPKIFGEVGKDEKVQQHLQDFVALALLCTQASNENERPDMINVSKELERIQKSTFPGC